MNNRFHMIANQIGLSEEFKEDILTQCDEARTDPRNFIGPACGVSVPAFKAVILEGMGF